MNEQRKFGDAQTFNKLELKIDLTRIEWMKKLAHSNGCKDPMRVLDEMMVKGEWSSSARVSEQSNNFYWLDVVASDYMRLNTLYHIMAKEIMSKGNEDLKKDLCQGLDSVPAKEGELQLRGFARSAPYSVVLSLIEELDRNYLNHPDQTDHVFESRIEMLFGLVAKYSSLDALGSAYSEAIGA